MWSWLFDESQQTLVIAILGFIAAFLLIHYYLKFRNRRTIISRVSAHNDLVESLLSQYTAKLAATTKIIENISLRLQLVESALEQMKPMLKPKVPLKEIDANIDNDNNSRDASDVDSKSDITKSYHELHNIYANNYQNDADDFTNMTGLILKLLSENPMNTKEIQSKVKRTREHTSRFMKRLFLQGLVSREMDTKPFVYALTDEGRKQLKVFRNDV